MRLFTFPEAAEHCGVNVKTLRKHAKEGHLATVKTPLGIRISDITLTPYIEAKAGHRTPEESATDQPEPPKEEAIASKEDHDLPLPTIKNRSKPAQEEPASATELHENPLLSRSTSVPLEAHLSALKLVEAALERSSQSEAKAEEQRCRAELAERQRLALEMQLRQYQLALADQAESLAEAYARQQAAELRLESIKAETLAAPEKTPDLEVADLRISTSRPSFGQRIKRFLGFSHAAGS